MFFYDTNYSDLDLYEMSEGGSIPDRYKEMGFNRVGQKKKSTRDGKKWMVLAKKGDQYKVVHGGAEGMSDYTKHKDPERRKRFWKRHEGGSPGKSKDPFSPLYWHKRLGTWKDGGSTFSGNAWYQEGGPFDTLNTAWNSDPFNLRTSPVSVNPSLPKYDVNQNGNQNGIAAPIKKVGNEWYSKNRTNFDIYTGKVFDRINNGIGDINEFINSEPMQNVLLGNRVLSGLTSAALPFASHFDNKSKIRNMNNRMREDFLPDNSINPSYFDNRGDYEMNNGMLRPDRMGFKSKGYVYKYGGQNGNLSLDINSRYQDFPSSEENYTNTLGPVPRYAANIEAEKGETVYGDLDQDGQLEHMKIGGKRHYEGGTPLNVPDGSFVFSDTKKMKIKDPEILKMFGKTYKKSGYTPAEIAKKYDINKYKAILENPSSDMLEKTTAQMMIDNYNKKLSKLSVVQESVKGFPNGIPDVAQYGIPEMQYGGYLPKYQSQGEVFPRAINPFGQIPVNNNQNPVETDYRKKYSWFTPFTKPKTPSGGKSRTTGKSTTYDFNIDNQYKKLAEWEKHAGRDFKNLEDLQGYIYSTLEQNPEGYKQINRMWDQWGPTLKSNERNISNFADKWLGARTAFLLENSIVPEKPQNPGSVIGYVCLGLDEDGNPNIQDSSYPSEQAVKQAGAFLTQAEAAASCTGKPIIPGIPPGKDDPTPFDYTTPDKLNMFISSMNAPNFYGPRRNRVNYEDSDVIFEDWRGKAAARQSMYNTSANALGNYQSPQSLASNLSMLSGQNMEGLANDIAQVDSRNVNTYNAYSDARGQRRNANAVINAQFDDAYHTGSAVAKQQYDNSRRNYINNMAKTFGNAWANRMYLGMINENNPYYFIDPKTGRSKFKGKGRSIVQDSNYDNSSQDSNTNYSKYNEVFNQLKRQGLPDRIAENEAMNILRGKRATFTDTDMDGIPNSARWNANYGNALQLYQNMINGPQLTPF